MNISCSVSLMNEIEVEQGYFCIAAFLPFAYSLDESHSLPVSFHT